MPRLKGPVPQVQAKEGLMPQLVKKRRSGWAVLAMGALIASLLAVGAAPAAAIDEDSEQDHTTKATACLGDALGDAGFTDLGSLDAAVDDINCLAYYGITTGKTIDTYDPDTNVTRGQMALLLYRAANAMGVDLSEGDGDADFGDIAELGEDRQDAINALAKNGILGGRGDMAFDPHDDITRAEMAVALVSLVDKVSDSVGKNKEGLFVLGDPGALPNDSFGDAYAAVSEPVNNAISAAYELGITTGRPAGSDNFVPNDGVPRRNMATFIIRALAHSNVRPAGLTAQVSGAQITVSIRDEAFTPVVNQAVDAFRAYVAYESTAFKGDGTCSSRTSRVDGATKCEIDGADPVTQSDGNITLATLQGKVGDGLTVWIWSGDLNDKVNSDTDRIKIPVPKGAEDLPEADSVLVTTDLVKPDTRTDVMRAHFGSTVTVTIQLQGDPDTSGPKDSVNVGPPSGDPTEYTVVTEIFLREDADDTEDTDGERLSQSTQDLTIGPDGSASFTVTAVDPDDDPGDFNMLAVQYSVSGPIGEDAVNTIVFSDERRRVRYVTVSSNGSQEAPGDNSSAGNAVTVTVLDQFGRPFRGAAVTLESNNPTDPPDDRDGSTIRSTALLTGSTGTVRVGYSRTGGASEETLTAFGSGGADITDTQTATLNQDGEFPLDAPARACATDGTGTFMYVGSLRHVDDDDDPDTPARDDAEMDGDGDGNEDTNRERDVRTGRCSDASFYWVSVFEGTGSGTDTLDILSHDGDNQQVVVDNPDPDASEVVVTPNSVSYDSNDFFTVIAEDPDDDSLEITTPSTMEEFAAALAKATETYEMAKAAFDLAGSTGAAPSRPTLQWSSYVFDDPSDIASFTLDTNP